MFWCDRIDCHSSIGYVIWFSHINCVHIHYPKRMEMRRIWIHLYAYNALWVCRICDEMRYIQMKEKKSHRNKLPVRPKNLIKSISIAAKRIPWQPPITSKITHFSDRTRWFINDILISSSCSQLFKLFENEEYEKWLHSNIQSHTQQMFI